MNWRIKLVLRELNYLHSSESNFKVMLPPQKQNILEKFLEKHAIFILKLYIV